MTNHADIQNHLKANADKPILQAIPEYEKINKHIAESAMGWLDDGIGGYRVKREIPSGSTCTKWIMWIDQLKAQVEKFCTWFKLNGGCNSCILFQQDKNLRWQCNK